MEGEPFRLAARLVMATLKGSPYVGRHRSSADNGRTLQQVTT